MFYINIKKMVKVNMKNKDLEKYYDLCKIYFATHDEETKNDIIKLEQEIRKFYKVHENTLGKICKEAYKEVSCDISCCIVEKNRG